MWGVLFEWLRGIEKRQANENRKPILIRNCGQLRMHVLLIMGIYGQPACVSTLNGNKSQQKHLKCCSMLCFFCSHLTLHSVHK